MLLNHNSPAPESRNHWHRLLLIFSVACLIESAFYGQVGAFTPIYLPKLGLPLASVPMWTGAIMAISNVIGIPFLPLWGALADRYARKPIIIRSFIVELMGIVLMMVSGNIWIFVLGRALLSLSLGNSGLMMTTLSEQAPPNRLGLAFSIMNGAAPLAAFAGPLVGGLIVDRSGFPMLMGADGVLIVVVIVMLLVGYRDAFRVRSEVPVLRMAAESVFIIWRSKRVRMLFGALLFLCASWMLGFTYVPLAITALYKGTHPNSAVGIVMAVGGLMTLLLSPIMGALSDRFGHWKVLIIGAVVSLVLWPLPAFTHNLFMFGAAWAALNGVTSGIFAISFAVMSNSVSDDVRGRVMSFAYLPFNIGAFLGPAIGSLAIKSNVFAIFHISAILTGMCIAVLLIARRQAVDIAPANTELSR